MDQTLFEKQRELTERLNRFRNEYYNLNAPSVSDAVYDRLFDELKQMEQQTGICLANSPTRTVGYPMVSRLENTRHEIPLLSLDKTKSGEDLTLFQKNQQVMLMLKLDGLTVKLTYENGRLMEAACRISNGRQPVPVKFPLSPYSTQWRLTAVRCPEPVYTTCPLSRIWS